ncbi:ABC transporter permease [Martelella radicis]|uniref:Ribose/xylose/arabinose/galactoside ABC-type transport system permease subunit n=1 Tax=Martelella radicis TaxID=1397476 RepID=A0A7W6KKB8_9HYPH|nr:ABC transporter permease [Martelella radicis]MBB4122610.1 ribose/xylose/arabinose/galactoside ABC-type transport system permease subunit [Martelella radicis]
MTFSAVLSNAKPAGATWRALGLLAILLVVLFVFSGRVSVVQVMDNARQAVPLGLIALGQALILMMGRLDLSVGATAGLANVVLAASFSGDMDNMAAALAITVFFGLLVGLANGVLVVVLRIPAFLATLATSLVLAGAILVYTGGSPRGSIPAGFRVITEGWVFGILPWSVVIWIIASLLLLAFVHYSLAGRKMLLSGANARSARRNGIAADRMVIFSFVLASFMATLGGIMLSSITGMASIGIADTYTVDSIAAAVIGGALFTGGVFLPLGAAAGALILFFLQSLLYVLSLPPAARFVLQGSIIILALALSNFKKDR